MTMTQSVPRFSVGEPSFGLPVIGCLVRVYVVFKSGAEICVGVHEVRQASAFLRQWYSAREDAALVLGDNYLRLCKHAPEGVDPDAWARERAVQAAAGAREWLEHGTFAFNLPILDTPSDPIPAYPLPTGSPTVATCCFIPGDVQAMYVEPYTGGHPTPDRGPPAPPQSRVPDAVIQLLGRAGSAAPLPATKPPSTVRTGFGPKNKEKK